MKPSKTLKSASMLLWMEGKEGMLLVIPRNHRRGHAPAPPPAVPPEACPQAEVCGGLNISDAAYCSFLCAETVMRGRAIGGHAKPRPTSSEAEHRAQS